MAIYIFYNKSDKGELRFFNENSNLSLDEFVKKFEEHFKIKPILMYDNATQHGLRGIASFLEDGGKGYIKFVNGQPQALFNQN